jgi:hypothetical protein
MRKYAEEKLKSLSERQRACVTKFDVYTDHSPNPNTETMAIVSAGDEHESHA